MHISFLLRSQRKISARSHGRESLPTKLLAALVGAYSTASHCLKLGFQSMLLCSQEGGPYAGKGTLLHLTGSRMENKNFRWNDRQKEIFFVAAAVFLLAAFTLQLVYHAIRTSATVDEPDHILAGHRHWQCGDFGINPEHPPLLKLLATVPLNFRELSEPPWECGGAACGRD